MKLAVIGCRHFDDKELLEKVLNPKISEIDLLISGKAKGADSLAENWAEKNNIKTLIFQPNWEKYGRGAGAVRNRLIIDNCDECIAFWDYKSKGTKISIDYCKKIGKKFKIIQID